MTKEAKETIEGTLRPMVEAIVQNDWDHAWNIWTTEPCPYCRKYGPMCRGCPLATRCTPIVLDFDNMFEEQDDMVIGVILGLIWELEEL